MLRFVSLCMSVGIQIWPSNLPGSPRRPTCPIPRLPQRRHGPDGDEPDRPDRPGGDGPGERALQAPGRPPPPPAPHLRALVIRPIVSRALLQQQVCSSAQLRTNAQSTLLQNLALNVAEKGFTISVYNRSGDKTDAAVARAKKEGVGERLHGEQHSCDLALVSTPGQLLISFLRQPAAEHFVPAVLQLRCLAAFALSISSGWCTGGLRIAC